jgi:hypothetical protein
MRRSNVSLALVALASLASFVAPGCGHEEIGDDENVGTAAQLVESKAVSSLVAEGLAIKHQIFAENLSVDEVKGLHIGSLSAEDVDGDPAILLVFTSPSPEIASPLAFGRKLLEERGEKGDEGDEGGEGVEPAPGETSAAVGGATTRLQVSAAGKGLDWLVDFARAVEAAGGEDHIKRIVAASSTAFLLEDEKGQLWDVSTAERVPDEVLSEKLAQVREAKAAVLGGELGQNLVKQWEMLEKGYDPKEMPQLNEARDPGEFAGKDGHLDLAKVAEGLDLSLILREVKLDETSVPNDGGGDGGAEKPAGPGLETQSRWVYTDACYSWWFFGWHTNCRTGEQGSFWNPGWSQAHRAIQSARFTVPRCWWMGGGTVYNTWEGCGPAAFTSLVWNKRRQGVSFAGIPPFSYNANNTYDQWHYGYDAAWGADFQTVMGNQVPAYMGSCSFGNYGTTTTFWDFVSGGDRWLKDHGSNLRVGSRYTVFGANSFDAPAKANILRGRLGYENGPVVAAFDVGFVSSHYSPVNRYKIINPYPGNFWETTQVFIEGLDQGQSNNRWYALHDPFALVAGLFWLQ